MTVNLIVNISNRYRHKICLFEIEEVRQIYEPYSEAVDTAQRILADNMEQDDAWDELAPETQHNNEEDKRDKQPQQDTGIEDYDISLDIGLPISATEDDVHDYNELPDDKYREHMRTLNKEQ